jgi:hypothetical protein
MKEQELINEWKNLKREGQVLALRHTILTQTLNALSPDGIPLPEGAHLPGELKALRKELLRHRHRTAKLLFLLRQKNQLDHLN